MQTKIGPDNRDWDAFAGKCINNYTRGRSWKGWIWSGIVLEGGTFGKVSCMQVIPFHCVFISNGALFGDDDVKKFVSGLITMGIWQMARPLRWDLGVVPAIILECCTCAWIVCNTRRIITFFKVMALFTAANGPFGYRRRNGVDITYDRWESMIEECVATVSSYLLDFTVTANRGFHCDAVRVTPENPTTLWTNIFRKYVPLSYGGMIHS